MSSNLKENNSKTLIFTTSYSDNLQNFDVRVLKWLKYHSTVGLNYTKILIIDDGSPKIPTWDGVEVIKDNMTSEPNSKVVLIRLTPHLGRILNTNHDYPGWYRSFSFAAKYAKAFNYDKVIHIESDAFVSSQRIIDHFNQLDSGWHAMWCSRHRFPETAIQVICKDFLNTFYQITSITYQYYKGHAIETVLPFTNVETKFTGDRYGEYLDIPPVNCDYVCQCRDEWEMIKWNI